MTVSKESNALYHLYKFLSAYLFDKQDRPETFIAKGTQDFLTGFGGTRLREMVTYDQFLDSFPGLLTKSGLKHQLSKNDGVAQETREIGGRSYTVFCPLEMLEQIQRTCKSPATKKKALHYLEEFYECD